MIVQVAFLSESETTLDADEWLVLGVNELVPRELGLDPELLLAYVARVVLLAGVRGHVGQHFLSPAESLVAVRARMREVISVQLAVDVQGCLGFKGLPA